MIYAVGDIHGQLGPLEELIGKLPLRDGDKLIFIGDASMSPYEIIHPGGSVEHWNEEPGAVWMGRLLATYPSAIWLNPEPQHRWEYTPSIGLTREIMGERMFPLTLAGLDQGIKELQKAGSGINA